MRAGVGARQPVELLHRLLVVKWMREVNALSPHEASVPLLLWVSASLRLAASAMLERREEQQNEGIAWLLLLLGYGQRLVKGTVRARACRRRMRCVAAVRRAVSWRGWQGCQRGRLAAQRPVMPLCLERPLWLRGLRWGRG